MKKLLLIIFLLVILIPVLALGFMGFMPGLSSLLGTNKPRDLGIKYTRANLSSIRSKSQVQYTVLPETSVPVQTRQFSGARQVTAEFSAAEITATMNNQPWIYWPYKNVQVKFHADGSGEISGTLIKNKVPGYAAAIGIPQQAADFVMKFLPNDPVFYVKMKAALTDNKVSLFEPEKLEIGRIPLPLNTILALQKLNLAPKTYAQNIKDITDELSKVSNKKALIIEYINSRLSSAFGSFYAKKAYCTEDKLYFDGTLSEKISYTP